MILSIIFDLLDTTLSTLFDVAPIAAILVGFQVGVLRQRIPNARRVMIGSVYVILGLAFFLFGLERALFPLGKEMAEQLTDPAVLGEGATDFSWLDYYWAYIFAFAIGFSTTIAEPSLIAVALKARTVSGGAVGAWGLRVAVALGVAVSLAVGTIRIVTGTPLYLYMIVGYIIVVVQTLFAPRMIVPLAYDSGGRDHVHRHRTACCRAGSRPCVQRAGAQCPARRFRADCIGQPVSDDHGHGLCTDHRLAGQTTEEPGNPTCGMRTEP